MGDVELIKGCVDGIGGGDVGGDGVGGDGCASGGGGGDVGGDAGVEEEEEEENKVVALLWAIVSTNLLFRRFFSIEREFKSGGCCNGT